MAQPSKGVQVSAEEASLIETYQPGIPLHLYHLRPGYILFIRLISVLILVFCLALFVFFVLISYGDWYRSLIASPRNGKPYLASLFSFPYYIVPFFMCFCGFLGWLFMARSESRRVQEEKIIVCEQGMLHREKKRKKIASQAVLWSEIQTLVPRYFGLEYVLLYRGAEPLYLSMLYQDFNGLLTLIKQQSEGRS